MSRSRSSIIATLYNDAWGTRGTQYMTPVAHIEGIGSWAAKMDDRMCFLAYQQADVVFSEDINKQYSIPLNQLVQLDRYKVYYSGFHPQMLIGFEHRYTGGGAAPSATYSLRMGDVDFGTIRVQAVDFNGGSVVDWYADLPEGFVAGEYPFWLYCGSGDTGFQDIDAAAGAHLTFLPTRKP